LLKELEPAGHRIVPVAVMPAAEVAEATSEKAIED
jgi:hypothetical protein